METFYFHPELWKQSLKEERVTVQLVSPDILDPFFFLSFVFESPLERVLVSAI